MKSCLACFGVKIKSKSPPESFFIVDCGKCHSSNRMEKMDFSSYGFVCSVCGVVNRVDLSGSSLYVDSSMVRISTDSGVLFRKKENFSLSVCSVCLDDFADVNLEPCIHSLCENCAIFIAKNKAVGGPHCPTCREVIGRILRVIRVADHQIEVLDITSETQSSVRPGKPPRIPPPPGDLKKRS